MPTATGSSATNPDQADADGDNTGDVCDNCPDDPAKTDPGICGCGQSDGDPDGDGIVDCDDNCPNTTNQDQTNSDGDSFGDACDNCPDDDNEDQANSDGDTLGDVCDNCPTTDNEDQANSDADTLGDACDNCPDDDNEDQANDDNDTPGNICDNCPNDDNEDQADADGDGIGDVCDTDRDGDGVDNDQDNCPDDANNDQADSEADGIGDACDACPCTEGEACAGMVELVKVDLSCPGQENTKKGGDWQDFEVAGGCDGEQHDPRGWTDDNTQISFVVGDPGGHANLFSRDGDPIANTSYLQCDKPGCTPAYSDAHLIVTISGEGHLAGSYILKTYHAWDGGSITITSIDGASSSNVVTPPTVQSTGTDDELVPAVIEYTIDNDGDSVTVNFNGNGLNAWILEGAGGSEEPDADGDGVPDCLDQCPGEDDTIDVDPEDGIPDCYDRCPDDPEKTEPGQCGCGAADTDSDGDGVADCIDECPGQDDNLNSDGDSHVDCKDNCPNDDNEDQADADNDGLGDVCDCPCLGDMTGDGWKAANDISVLISQLLPHKSSYYWVLAEPDDCGDMNSDGWKAPNDISVLISQLLPYATTYYWVLCP